MEPSTLDEGKGNPVLNQIREGMRVCDNAGQEIGEVRRVFLGAVSDETNSRGGGPVSESEPEWRDETLIDNLAEAFAADDPLPETLRGRLLRHGYIQIDTHGLFASDRFALPDQIVSITDDCVRLNVTKDELIER